MVNTDTRCKVTSTQLSEECVSVMEKSGIDIRWGKKHPYPVYGYKVKCPVCNKAVRVQTLANTHTILLKHVRRHTANALRAWWICAVLADPDPVPDIPF